MDKTKLAEEFFNNKDILIGDEFNQLVLITSGAKFILEEDEPVTVGILLFFCLKQTDVLPKITEDSGKRLGAKCLIGTSLYRGALEKLTIRHGAPSVKFYVGVGKSVFRQQDMKSIAENFDNWASFLAAKFNK